MHPNLFKHSPLHTHEPSTQLSRGHSALIAGIWVVLFIIGVALLP